MTRVGGGGRDVTVGRLGRLGRTLRAPQTAAVDTDIMGGLALMSGGKQHQTLSYKGYCIQQYRKIQVKNTALHLFISLIRIVHFQISMGYYSNT